MTSLWVIIVVLAGGIVTNSPYSFPTRDQCEIARTILEASPIAPEREYTACHEIIIPWAVGEAA